MLRKSPVFAVVVTEHFWADDRAAASLRTGLPEIFADLPYRGTPESSRTTDFNGRGFVGRQPLERLLRDIDYIFEVRSNSELEVPLRCPDPESRIFITHGRAPDWREVQAHIEHHIKNTLDDSHCSIR